MVLLIAINCVSLSRYHCTGHSHLYQQVGQSLVVDLEVGAPDQELAVPSVVGLDYLFKFDIVS